MSFGTLIETTLGIIFYCHLRQIMMHSVAVVYFHERPFMELVEENIGSSWATHILQFTMAIIHSHIQNVQAVTWQLLPNNQLPSFISE